MDFKIPFQICIFLVYMYISIFLFEVNFILNLYIIT